MEKRIVLFLSGTKGSLVGRNPCISTPKGVAVIDSMCPQ
jgi:hypothetical protein